MIDRETIMTWLKKCGNGGCSSRCPYDDLGPDKCYETLMTDALELLTNEPLSVRNVGKYGVYYGDCPTCGKRIYYKISRYCPHCGQAVKWDG